MKTPDKGKMEENTHEDLVVLEGRLVSPDLIKVVVVVLICSLMNLYPALCMTMVPPSWQHTEKIQFIETYLN